MYHNNVARTTDLQDLDNFKFADKRELPEVKDCIEASVCVDTTNNQSEELVHLAPAVTLSVELSMTVYHKVDESSNKN